MKTAEVGIVLKWRGRLARVISTVVGEKMIGIEYLEADRCPNCDFVLDKKQFDVVERSPLFQECAESVETLEE